MSNNHEWQLAFWLITVICGVWLLSLTSAVVANERLRVADDKAISLEVIALLQQNNEAHSVILTKLTRLETLISR